MCQLNIRCDVALEQYIFYISASLIIQNDRHKLKDKVNRVAIVIANGEQRLRKVSLSSSQAKRKSL